MYAALVPPPLDGSLVVHPNARKKCQPGPPDTPPLAARVHDPPLRSMVKTATGRLNGRTLGDFSYTRMRQYSLIGYIISPLIMELE
jgi:hypothetical protein